VGDVGLDITHSLLESVKKQESVHLTIANGENCAAGKGLTERLAEGLFDIGVDVITSGNHIWNRDKFFPFLNRHPRMLRPLNYPPDCPGHGSCIVIASNTSVGVINLQGRSFMYSIDCPFRIVEAEIAKMKEQDIKTVIVDFHAEATAEKIALAWFLDGKASAVIGSHTHVQTADERVLPKGTATITDAGMTGSIDSVIGMDVQTAIRRFMTQIPTHYQVAQGNPRFCGVIVQINPATGKAATIRRIQLDLTFA
jgi:metallophosphoesterase (TIGR00282 family)